MFNWLIRRAPDKSDLFLYCGMGFLGYGAFLIYPPAAYLLTGCIFTALSAIQAKAKLPEPPTEQEVA